MTDEKTTRYVEARTDDWSAVVDYDGVLDSYVIILADPDADWRLPREFHPTLALAIERLAHIEAHSAQGDIADYFTWYDNTTAGSNLLDGWQTALEQWFGNRWSYDSQTSVYWVEGLHFMVGIDNHTSGVTGQVQAMAYAKAPDGSYEVEHGDALLSHLVGLMPKFGPDLAREVFLALTMWDQAAVAILEKRA